MNFHYYIWYNKIVYNLFDLNVNNLLRNKLLYIRKSIQPKSYLVRF